MIFSVGGDLAEISMPTGQPKAESATKGLPDPGFQWSEAKSGVHFCLHYPNRRVAQASGISHLVFLALAKVLS